MRTYKRKTDRGSASKDAIEDAVQAHVKGGLSLRNAGAQYGVNYKTLSRYVKKFKENEESLANVSCGWTGHRIIFEPEQEIAIADYVKKAAAIYYGITMGELRKLAFSMAKENCPERMPENWRKDEAAGYDWAQIFLKRHPDISLRSPEATSIERMAAFNPTNVAAFMKNLEEALSRHGYGPDQIWNLDETGCTTVQKPRKILAMKGSKQVGSVVSQERGTLVTVCCAVNALGNHIPPYFVFPRVNVQENWLLTAPPGSGASGHPKASGWMTEENFVKYMQHFVKYAKPTAQSPILLLLDNHQSHLSIEVIDFAKDNNITMLSFPPHCSHRLQPLDVGVYGPFKTFYSQACDNWMRESQNAGKKVTIGVIPKMVAYALPKAMTPANITSGFRATGIYPFDRNIFTEDHFLSNYATDRPMPATTEEASTSTSSPSHTGQCEVQPSTPNSTSTLDSNAPRTMISPEDIRPFGRLEARKPDAVRRRKKGQSQIFTDTPIRNQLLEEKAKKGKGRKQQTLQTKAKKTLFKEKTATPAPVQPADSDTSEREMHLTDSPVQDQLPQKRGKKQKNPKKTKKTNPSPDQASDSEASESEIELADSSDDDVVPMGHENEPPIEGDFVVVRVAGKKRSLEYIARIDVVDDAEFEGVFLKKARGLDKSDQGGCFIVNMDDEATFVKEDIIGRLPAPKSLGGTSRRNACLAFPENSLKKFNILG